MLKNTASQKVTVFAFDSTTNTPKTGDAANISAYISKDDGAVTQLTDTSATELDSTNAKGYYQFDISQTETNADKIILTAKSSTSNIVVVGAPAVIYTLPPNFTTTSIDASGRVDVAKIAGTSQTARDIGASVLLSAGTGTGQLDFTSGVVKANVTQFGGSAGTFSSGIPAVNATQFAGATVTATTSVTFPAASTVATTTGAVGSVTGAVGSVTGNVGGNVVGSVGSVSGAVGSVTGNVGGNVTGSVGSVVGNVGGNVTGSVGSISGVTFPTNFADLAITVTTGRVTVGTNADKTGYALTSAYDAAKTAAQAGDAMALTSSERNSVATALLDLANGVETSYTVRQVFRLLAAACGSKIDGAASTTLHIRDLGDTKNRVTATVDADGNRTAITLDLT